MQTDILSRAKSDLNPSKSNDRTIVLVVDDSQDTLTMLTDVLTFENLEVLTAKDGPRAIQLANEARPDVILMDAIMPGMDGFETTEQMRAFERENNLSPTPIIALTAHALVTGKQRGLDAGCNAYLTKPVNFDRLVNKIHQLIGVKTIEN